MTPTLTMYAPWFGPLPFYAGTFLYCCGLAPDVQWVIHSDQARPASAPDNVAWYEVDPDIRPYIQRVFPIPLPHPLYGGHKLCDHKPWWHRMFFEGHRSTHVGWIDWDCIHNLSAVPLGPGVSLFCKSLVKGPLVVADVMPEYYPSNPRGLIYTRRTVGYDESVFLPMVETFHPHTYVQGSPRGDQPYAVHALAEKADPPTYYNAATEFLLR